jgi:hypothetical protein
VSGSAEEPARVVRESVEEHPEVDHNESHDDETPAEEDRREEAERLHAPARRREPWVKKTRERVSSESEQASSFKLRKSSEQRVEPSSLPKVHLRAGLTG